MIINIVHTSASSFWHFISATGIAEKEGPLLMSTSQPNLLNAHGEDGGDKNAKPDQPPHNVHLAFGSSNMQRIYSSLKKNFFVRRQNKIRSAEKKPWYLLMGLEHRYGEGGDAVLSAGVDVNLLLRQQHLHYGQVSLKAGKSESGDSVLADVVDLCVLPGKDALHHPPVALDAGEHERAQLPFSSEVHVQIGSGQERQGDLKRRWSYLCIFKIENLVKWDLSVSTNAASHNEGIAFVRNPVWFHVISGEKKLSDSNLLRDVTDIRK